MHASMPCEMFKQKMVCMPACQHAMQDVYLKISDVNFHSLEGNNALLKHNQTLTLCVKCSLRDESGTITSLLIS